MHKTVFTDLIIFRRVSGSRLDIHNTLALAEAFRGALMKASGQQPPAEWLSGHTPDGKRTEEDHLAFIALPDVGHVHAGGELKGVALAIPHNVPRGELDACLRRLFSIDEWGDSQAVKLVLGHAGDWLVIPDDFPRQIALSKRTWAGPARIWASVTPIVLDRYPKAEGDTEELIARACERIGLPRPAEIIPMPGSPFEGAPPARRMPTLPKKFGKTLDQHTHARLAFTDDVCGPVLLGAGRYRGYGLCRPYGGDA
jgi:CRISPR-associated protein Csb2